MSDNYQAIYDAVRSRLSGCDPSQAIEAVVREAFSGAHYVMQGVEQEWSITAREHRNPSAIYKPSLSIDGGQWCALYGDNLQDGVAGFGDSPAAAMADFDRAWTEPLPAKGPTRSRADAVLREIGFPDLRATPPQGDSTHD